MNGMGSKEPSLKEKFERDRKMVSKQIPGELSEDGQSKATLSQKGSGGVSKNMVPNTNNDVSIQSVTIVQIAGGFQTRFGT